MGKNIVLHKKKQSISNIYFVSEVANENKTDI